MLGRMIAGYKQAMTGIVFMRLIIIIGQGQSYTKIYFFIYFWRIKLKFLKLFPIFFLLFITYSTRIFDISLKSI